MKYLLLLFLFIGCKDSGEYLRGYNDGHADRMVIQGLKRDMIFFNDRNSVVYIHDTIYKTRYKHDTLFYEGFFDTDTTEWRIDTSFWNLTDTPLYLIHTTKQ